MSRVARSALSFAASTAASAVGLVAAFVATPLVLRGLGPERLGAFRAAAEWGGYLGLLELGLAGALAPLFARAAASGDREQVRSVLATGVRAYLRVTLWTLLAGGVLWAVLPQLVRVPAELDGEFRLGFALGLAGAVLMPLNVYRPLAEALQKGYIASAFLCVQTVAIAIGCALAALSDWGLPGQFAITAAGGLILPLGLLLVLRRAAHPGELLLRRPPAADEDARRLGKLNRTTLLFFVSGRVFVFTDNIVVGLLLGPAAVASYFLTTRLAQAASGQVQAVGNATWAGLAELYHSGRHEVFRQRLTELTRLTSVLSGAVIVPLAALTAPFVSLWVGPDQYAGHLVAALVVLNGVMLPVYSLWGWVFTGLGRIDRLLPYTIALGVMTLAASLLATWAVGIAGPPLAAAVANLLYNPWWLSRLMRTEFGVPWQDLFGAAVLPLVPAAAILGGLVSGYAIWPGASWARLACELGAAAGLYLVIAWPVVLGESERRTFWRLFGGRASDVPPR